MTAWFLLGTWLGAAAGYLLGSATAKNKYQRLVAYLLQSMGVTAEEIERRMGERSE